MDFSWHPFPPDRHERRVGAPRSRVPLIELPKIAGPGKIPEGDPVEGRYRTDGDGDGDAPRAGRWALDRWRVLVLGGCVGLGLVGLPDARAQGGSRERSVSVTGPGGRTIERHFSASRGGGQIDRQLSISRPGGTLERSVHASAAPGFRPGPRPGPGFGGGHHGHWFGPPPRSGPDPLLSFGIGALTGAAVAAPLARMTAPSRVVVASPPMVVGPAVVAAPPPMVVVEEPVVVAAPVDPLDPVALAAQRLQSYHGGTRREAAESLGLLGDPRGVAPLVDALKNDWNSGVRVAAATALGRIGGPEAEAVLGRAVVYEKKDAVRDAAAQALHAARATSAAVAATPTETVIESRVDPLPPASSRPATPTTRAVPTPPAPRPPAWQPSRSTQLDPLPLEPPSLDDEPFDDEPLPDRVPPPPPVPVRG